MRLYLYLEKNEYVSTWANGGIVPLKLASTYHSEERNGIYTPDELLQRYIKGTSLEVVEQLFGKQGKGGSTELNIGTIIMNNQIVGRNVKYLSKLEDSLILFLSTKLDKKIAERMNKSACVEITNINKLISTITKQIGVTAIAKKCDYTLFENRNHFLKSVLDCWQEEYRIVWKNIKKSIEVQIPKGCAKDISHLIK